MRNRMNMNGMLVQRKRGRVGNVGNGQRGGSLVSQGSRARRQMSWATVGAILAMFIKLLFVFGDSFLRSSNASFAFSSRSSRLTGENFPF